MDKKGLDLGALGEMGKYFSRGLDEVRLIWALLSDERVPNGAKAALGASVLYLFVPLDVIPDFIPVLGQLDDLVFVYLGIRALKEFSPVEVVAEHQKRISNNRKARTEADPENKV